MKEDLILIPELDVFKSLIADAKHDLAEMDMEGDEELSARRELALDVVNILDEKIKGVKNITNIDFKDKIWFAAHLYLLETILEDLFEEDDDAFFFEEEEEEEEEDKKH